ncbi:hypothetical protein ACSBOB_08960 [Mesorhizobium sp. ASY16-5R]|uniref:hypothetical protein n=1 Tax=Mesorhizobium sp. ASY16-5R TaxID=3445772 RepID=UPI003FA047C9
MATTNWTGAGDGVHWYDPSNWDNGVPTPSTPALIRPDNIFIDFSGAPGSAQSLGVGNGVQINFASPFTVTSGFNNQGGTIVWGIGSSLTGNFLNNGGQVQVYSSMRLSFDNFDNGEAPRGGLVVYGAGLVLDGAALSHYSAGVFSGHAYYAVDARYSQRSHS